MLKTTGWFAEIILDMIHRFIHKTDIKLTRGGCYFDHVKTQPTKSTVPCNIQCDPLTDYNYLNCLFCWLNSS